MGALPSRSGRKKGDPGLALPKGQGLVSRGHIEVHPPVPGAGHPVREPVGAQPFQGQTVAKAHLEVTFDIPGESDDSWVGSGATGGHSAKAIGGHDNTETVSRRLAGPQREGEHDRQTPDHQRQGITPHAA